MQFQLFGIPVQVRTGFWLIAFVVAMHQKPASLLMATMAVVFVAVMVHELGHALVARAFGVSPAIVLHNFGGSTLMGGVRLSRLRNILVTAAGPLAGLALGLLAWLVNRVYPAVDPFWVGLYKQTLFVTVGWGILNLLPVFPLDGGLIVRDVVGPRFHSFAYGLSALIGIAIVVFAFKAKLIFPTILFAMFTYESLKMLFTRAQATEEEVERNGEAERQLLAAQAALESGALDEAGGRATVVLQIAGDARARDRARRILAAVAIQREDAPAALEALRTFEEPLPDDDILRAQALDVAGERDAAFAILEKRTHEHPEGPTFGPLIQGFQAVGKIDEIASLARRHAPIAQPDALQLAAQILHDEGRFVDAGGVWAVLLDRVGTARFALAAAKSFARAGDVKRALSLFEQAFELGYAGLREEVASQDLDALREEPRFLAIAARL